MPARTRVPRTRAGGFTLLEMLVALALFGLVALIAFGGLRLGTRAWQAGTAKTDAMSELRLQQGFLRDTLMAAYPAVLTEPPDPPLVAFDGQDQAVTFLAPLKAHLALGGLYRMALRFDQGPQGGRLILTWRLHQPDVDFLEDLEGAEERVLVEDVAEVAFAYLGADRPGDSPEWLDRWQDRAELPRLVRLHLAFTEAARRDWPDLVVPLRVELDVGCLFDSGTGKCRNR